MVHKNFRHIGIEISLSTGDPGGAEISCSTGCGYRYFLEFLASSVGPEKLDLPHENFLTLPNFQHDVENFFKNK